MHLARLYKKGWTKKEVKFVERLLIKAEKKKHPFLRSLEPALFWMLIVTLIILSMGSITALLPFLLFSSMGAAIPIIFLLGTCFGLLFVHVIRDLQLEKPHQHAGATFLVLGTISAVAWVLTTLPAKLEIIRTPSDMLAIACTFSSAIVITYVAHWRVTHETK